MTGEPEIQNREVLLWSQFGQRVLLDVALQIRADNGNGGLLVMNGETTNITQDVAIARDLLVNRDTKVNHLLGGSDTVLTCVPNVAGGFATATALGNDLAFDVTFTVAPSVTVNPGTEAGDRDLCRAFGIGWPPLRRVSQEWRLRCRSSLRRTAERRGQMQRVLARRGAEWTPR